MGPTINSSKYTNYTNQLLSGMPIPGARFNPSLVSDNIEEDPSNILYIEQQRTKHLYQQIVQMAE